MGNGGRNGVSLTFVVNRISHKEFQECMRVFIEEVGDIKLGLSKQGKLEREREREREREKRERENVFIEEVGGGIKLGMSKQGKLEKERERLDLRKRLYLLSCC